MHFFILLSFFLSLNGNLFAGELFKFGVEQVVDSLERFEIPYCVFPGEEVKPLHPSMKVSGIVSTVEFSCLTDGKNRTCSNNRAYLDQIPEGSVLLIHQRSGDGACFGSVLSCYSQQRGILGVIILGNSRDAKDLRKSAFPVFSKGKHCLRSTPRLKITGIQQPILVRDKTISPGDFVFADESGTVIFKSEHKEKIFSAAKSKLHQEEIVLDLIKSNKKWPQIDTLLQ